LVGGVIVVTGLIAARFQVALAGGAGKNTQARFIHQGAGTRPTLTALFSDPGDAVCSQDAWGTIIARYIITRS
jgi:hypothetical protein